MDSQPDYPLIDPITFDLVVIGTGVSEAILSAAASAVGKTVLHLDANPFYGSHTASLSLSDLSSFLQSPPASSVVESKSESSPYALLRFERRPLLSDLEIRRFDSSAELDALSLKFLLDICGPRVILSASEEIELLIRSGASNYVEFKSVEASFIFESAETLKLCRVPDSRASIFKDKGLSLPEKNQLMRFFKLVQSHLAANASEQTEGEQRQISEEDLESPFVEFLSKMKLPSNIQSMILYAIAMADEDQDTSTSEHLLKTKEGIARMALYQASVGRFTNTLGAMLYPIYGFGEIPQSFCRSAAVKGCVYVLRMPVMGLLVDKNDGCYKGVTLASGQEIFSDRVILDPSFIIPSQMSSPLKQVNEGKGSKRRVARGICIIKSSIAEDTSNFVVVFPPRSLFREQFATVRALQVSSNFAVCPTELYVLYLSTHCTNSEEGKHLLNTAINAILSTPQNPQSGKPSLLWSSIYLQDLTPTQFGSASSTAMPDGSFTHHNVLQQTISLFHEIYPNDELFPKSQVKYSLEEEDERSQY